MEESFRRMWRRYLLKAFQELEQGPMEGREMLERIRKIPYPVMVLR